MTKHWNVDAARAQYAIPHWGEGYFDVGDRGRLSVRPLGADGPALALPDIVDAARARGSRLPLLVRFADILRHRLGRLQGAFAQAMADWDYAGGYTAVYPVKVNQQKGVAGELAAVGGAGFGLEAGSKPELMAVLALARPGSIVICNGYKDREYLRLALIGRKLGLRVFIVIEKPAELAPALEEARALGVEPLFGVRVRLTSLGAGKWQNTGGEKSKFGLTPRQLLTLVDALKAANLTQSLRLL
ncbi:MAG TPA: arginine decarboxylase, partial [Rudaea sp.]|nr:arginine decarboxylase [Rudaea sp.]